MSEIVGSGADQSILLAPINGRSAVAEIAAAAKAYLDENEFIAVIHHEIELTTSRPIVSRNETKAAANEKTRGRTLGAAAESRRSCFGVRAPQSAERATHRGSRPPMPAA